MSSAQAAPDTGAGQVVGDGGQAVAVAGQRVLNGGQVVGVMAARVGLQVTPEAGGGQAVAEGGHCVDVAGQRVGIGGQVVGDGGHDVTACVQRVGIGGQLVATRGHIVAFAAHVDGNGGQDVRSTGQRVVIAGQKVGTNGTTVGRRLVDCPTAKPAGINAKIKPETTAKPTKPRAFDMTHLPSSEKTHSSKNDIPTISICTTPSPDIASKISEFFDLYRAKSLSMSRPRQKGGSPRTGSGVEFAGQAIRNANRHHGEIVSRPVWQRPPEKEPVAAGSWTGS